MSAKQEYLMLWRVGWGRISTRPVKCIDLGEGNIKVVGSCRTLQPRDERNESYHDTYQDALMRLVEDAKRDLDRARKEMANATRRLNSAKAKWMGHCAAPKQITDSTK